MGCSMASRSSAIWSISRSRRLMAGSAAEDQIADGEVARAVGLDGALDRLLGHAGHDEQLLLQVVEVLVKSNAHHPNLPVM